MQNKIVSLTNNKIKAVVRLRNHKQRIEEGLTIVEGLREMILALNAKIKFKEVFILPESAIWQQEGKELLIKLRFLKVPLFETSRQVFDKISFGERNEGVIGICETPKNSLNSLKTKKNDLIVVVEDIEKPGNLGAILRTCDAAGVDGVIITAQKTDIYNPNVIRASLGAIFTVKTVICSNEKAFDFLRSKDFKICCAIPNAKKIYSDVDFSKSTSIVLGSEDKGLSDFWIKNCDVGIVIPMKGRVDSLNVSISAAIIIYEGVRQRKFNYRQ